MALTAHAELAHPGNRETDGHGNVIHAQDIYVAEFSEPVESAGPHNITGVPADGSAHPDFPKLRAKSSYDPRNSGDKCTVWDITCTYEPPPGIEPDENEDVQYTDISGGSAGGTSPLTNDAVTGAYLLNAAGDPFTGYPTVDRDMTAINITRNENRSPSDVLDGYNNTINSAEVTIIGFKIPQYCGRVKITWKHNLTGSKRYRYEYTYNITIKHNIVKNINGDGQEGNLGHHIAFAQVGYNFIDHNDGKKKKRYMEVGEDGEERPSPDVKLLTKDGGDGRGLTDAVNTPVHAYQESAWSGLRLPTSMPTIHG